MKVDTMRRIDYFVGVPLCFLLQLWFALLHLLVRPKTQRPEKMLFIELSEMGSAILVDPALREAKAQGATLYFVIFKKNKASLDLLKTIPEANIFTLRDDGLFALGIDTLKFLIWTRRQRIDTVVDLELFSRFTALLSRLSGASNLVGFDAFHNEGLYRGRFLSHRVAYNPTHHISKNFMALIHAAFSEKNELPFTKRRIEDNEIQLAKAANDPEGQAQIRQLITQCYPDYQPEQQRLVLINPNASDLLPQRRWPPERFIQVMKSLVEQYEDVLVLITGAPAEATQAQTLTQAVDHPRCINFAGKLRFDQLVPLYQLSELMLTNDSGPGHFAAVTELPTYVIFGPETPALYGSLGNSTPIYAHLACSPCVSASNHRKTPCQDNVCLQVIHPEQVFQQLKKQLGT